MSFDIGFLTVSIWDILDILIVGFLIYQLYKLLRGSIAFNIFIGVVLLAAVWWLVQALSMDLLSLILDQFVRVGVIIIIIIFQPEIRRFLLILGNTTLRQRSKFLDRLLAREWQPTERRQKQIKELQSAIVKMSKRKIGALIVFSDKINLASLVGSGLQLDANISEQLLLSIFQKDSPLHDGAVVISGNKIQLASCILPISHNDSLPQKFGLRHRAGVGITENSNLTALMISEQNGKISFAQNGELRLSIQEHELEEILTRAFV